MPRIVDGGRPCPGQIECKEVDPWENRRAVYISPHNSGTVTDIEKVQLMQVESRPWAF